MRKNLFLLLSVILLLALSGCKYGGDVKVYENTEDVVVVHPEASATVVITDMNFEENIFSFIDCLTGVEFELGYHGGVAVQNTYGDTISINEVYNGSVVDVVYYSDTMKLVSIGINDSTTVIKGVNKFVPDPENQKARYGGTTRNMASYVVAYDQGEPIDIMEISTEDQITLHIYRDKLVSVVVELGHGYVRLENHDTYVGGMVEVGYDVIVPVTKDMLLTVREGSYTLRINRNGYSQTKEINVIKGKETRVDMANLAIPTGTATFEITPSDARIYINGERLYGSTYTNIYGSYNLKIEADGYRNFRGSFKIDEPVNDFEIELKSLEEDDEEEEDDEKTTEDSTETSSENTETEGSDSSTEENTTQSDSSESTDTTEDTTSTDNTITVNEPVGVSVYVDGEYIGIAPVTFPKKVGSHTITLYQSGYIIKSYTIYASNNGKDDEYSFDPLTYILDTIE